MVRVRMEPLEFDEAGLPECGTCLRHYVDQPNLVEACASVGIEHGKSTRQMLVEYLFSFHTSGHRRT